MDIYFSRLERLASSGSRCQMIQCLARPLFLVCWQPSSCCFHTWWKERGLPTFTLHIRAFNPIVGTPPLWLHLTQLISQGPFLHVPSHWGVRLQHTHLRVVKEKNIFFLCIHTLHFWHQMCQFFPNQPILQLSRHQLDVLWLNYSVLTT